MTRDEAFAGLIAAPPKDPAQFDAALAAAGPFPLVRPNGAVFLYRGAADEVFLRLWVQGLSAAQPLTHVAGTDLWHVEIELPTESRIEYKFEITNGDETRWITDPLNPMTASDPFGRNSVLSGYGYKRPGWTLPDGEARPGSFDGLRVNSTAFGEHRDVRCYLPARFRRTRQYPLLIVHDGSDFLNYASMGTVLDNLIHRLLIPPMIVAFADPKDRLREYAGDDRHAAFLASELLPALEAKLPLADRPQMRGLMGASFGAVAALHAAWRYPGVFGRLLLESGSFAFSDIGPHSRGPAFDPVVHFVNAFRRKPGLPAERMFLSCGIYESLIYENRTMLPLLRDCGVQVRYEEVRDGHNWENWRDRLKGALTWLFHGPYWMVYE